MLWATAPELWLLLLQEGGGCPAVAEVVGHPSDNLLFLLLGIALQPLRLTMLWGLVRALSNE